MKNIVRQITDRIYHLEFGDKDSEVLNRDIALEQARLMIAYISLNDIIYDNNFEQNGEAIRNLLDLIDDLELNYNSGDYVKITLTTMGVFVTKKMGEA